MVGWVGRRNAVTKNPDGVVGTKCLTWQNLAAASGHDVARQALSELRGTVDPEREGIRRNLVQGRHFIGRDEDGDGCVKGFRGEQCDDLVAAALASVLVMRRRIV